MVARQFASFFGFMLNCFFVCLFFVFSFLSFFLFLGVGGGGWGVGVYGGALHGITYGIVTKNGFGLHVLAVTLLHFTSLHFTPRRPCPSAAGCSPPPMLFIEVEAYLDGWLRSLHSLACAAVRNPQQHLYVPSTSLWSWLCQSSRLAGPRKLS